MLGTIRRHTVAICANLFRRGYQRLGENVTLYQKDWHEGIDLYREMEEGSVQLSEEDKQKLSTTEHNFFYGRNQYPNEPPHFKEAFEQYIEVMKSLGLAIMHAMAMSLNLPEDFFDQYVDNSYWVMRIIGKLYNSIQLLSVALAFYHIRLSYVAIF